MTASKLKSKPAFQRKDEVGRRGFTLIELLIAITLLTIVISIVYGTFASVINSTEIARDAAYDMRARQFLSRSFTHNLAQATEGWSPGAAYRTFSQASSVEGEDPVIEGGVMRYWLQGENEEGDSGPADSLTFASTAPIAGGQGLPGFVKLVSYQVIQNETEDEDEFYAIPEGPPATLRVTETPLTVPAYGSSGGGIGADSRQTAGAFDGEQAMESASWEFPIRAMNIQYFDGEEWVDTWDSQADGRLPWAADIKVYFERDPGAEEEDDFFDEEEEPDYRLVFSIPVGAGIHDEPPDYVRPEGGRNPQGGVQGGGERR